MSQPQDNPQNSSSGCTLLYDGQCPFCSAYVRYYRLQRAVGELTLLDARQDSALKKRVTELGWDLDQGMVLQLGDNLYFGSDAIHMLALLSTRSGFFNRINSCLFQSPLLAKFLYPLCKAGRRVTLWMLGIEKINNRKSVE